MPGVGGGATPSPWGVRMRVWGLLPVRKPVVESSGMALSAVDPRVTLLLPSCLNGKWEDGAL